jgi:hypothetical protein
VKDDPIAAYVTQVRADRIAERDEARHPSEPPVPASLLRYCAQIHHKISRVDGLCLCGDRVAATGKPALKLVL